MRMWIKIVLSLLLVAVAAAPACAFTPSGTKAMGMGGAFTAVADDLSSVYWNPAGLTQTGYFDVDLSLALGGENTRELENLYKLYQAVENEDYDAAEDIAKKVSAPLSLSPTFTVGIGLFKRIALSGGLQAEFDIETFRKDEEEGYIEVEDVETALVPVYLSFARPTTESLTLGFNAKYMQAARHSSHFKIYPEDVQTIKDEMDRSRGVFSFDAGALYNKKGSPFTWGIMIENVIEPEFEFPDLSGDLNSMSLPRKVNAGLAYKPVSMLTLAADVHNLTDDATFHVGGEVDFKLIKLRAGLNDGDLTLGVGMNLFLFNLQVAYYEKDKKDPHVSLVLFQM